MASAFTAGVGLSSFDIALFLLKITLAENYYNFLTSSSTPSNIRASTILRAGNAFASKAARNAGRAGTSLGGLPPPPLPGYAWPNSIADGI